MDLIIRQHAFAEGRSRDGEWIVDFVATCFTGSALRWYETLSSEVQSNWDLLRKAMLSQYPVSIKEVDDSSDGSLQHSQVRTSLSGILAIVMNIRKNCSLSTSPYPFTEALPLHQICGQGESWLIVNPVSSEVIYLD